MKPILNPFLTTGYSGSEYFCNRIAETGKILKLIKEGQSITLTSIRRMGKTGLIQHVMTRLPKNWTAVYLDILSTERAGDFLNLLSTALINAVPEKSTAGEKFWTFIKSLRPVISFDALTGVPQVTIDMRPGESEKSIETILQFLEQQPGPVLLAIDEFQQILNFPEKNMDAWLRSIVQQLKNITFIFSGSQQHLMNELFSSPSRPFYRSTQFVKLDRIDPDEYRSFILIHFTNAGKKISPEIVDNMLEWADHYTYYVQLLCNRVFSHPDRSVSEKTWTGEAYRLLKEQETIFFNYRDLLTQSQWNLLKAIAHEHLLFTPTSREFLEKYHLGSSATVLQSLNSLMKKELVYSDHDASGTLFYSVYDLLFQRWIQQSIK